MRRRACRAEVDQRPIDVTIDTFTVQVLQTALHPVRRRLRHRRRSREQQTGGNEGQPRKSHTRLEVRRGKMMSAHIRRTCTNHSLFEIFSYYPILKCRMWRWQGRNVNYPDSCRPGCGGCTGPRITRGNGDESNNDGRHGLAACPRACAQSPSVRVRNRVRSSASTCMGATRAPGRQAGR